MERHDRGQGQTALLDQSERFREACGDPSRADAAIRVELVVAEDSHAVRKQGIAVALDAKLAAVVLGQMGQELAETMTITLSQERQIPSQIVVRQASAVIHRPHHSLRD
ncbi:MAG: hypothetical protein KGM24_06150 [Elusimicrobia bacterium]|nr:hypothetical protein [Elusimicrobiota bacterium]